MTRATASASPIRVQARERCLVEPPGLQPARCGPSRRLDLPVVEAGQHGFANERVQPHPALLTAVCVQEETAVPEGLQPLLGVGEA